MSRINKRGYVERKFRTSWNDVYLVKHKSEISQQTGYFRIGRTGDIQCPKEFIGKRVRLKIEMFE